MLALLLYLLKANVALLLFYLAYHLALRRLTFYTSNRLFLVFGLLFSSLYPFVDITDFFSRHQALATNYGAAVPAWVNAGAASEHAPVFDYWQIPVFILWAGAIVMMLRLLLQFAALYKIHAASEPAACKGIAFRQIQNTAQAFSFWQTIYLNPDQYTKQELASILRHEQVHVKQWHTLDVLLAELSTVFYWFNPGVWLLKKAIKENLEFIADQHVVGTGTDKKQYQYLLLKVTGTPQPQIANQFNFPSLKTRIAMMNKKQSSLMHIARYAVLVPLIVAPILFIACSKEGADSISPGVTAEEQDDIRIEEEVIPDVEVQSSIQATIPDSVVYYIDGKEVTNDAYKKLSPEEIHSINILKGESVTEVFGDKAGKSVISITTRKNKDSPQVLNFSKALPVPPPPVPEAPPAPPAPQQQSEAFIFTPNETDYYKDETKLPADYKGFLKRNPVVKQVGWKFSARKDYNLESVVIYLKSGATEVYDFNGNKSIPAAETKYGKLPGLLPPPPPVRIKQE